MAGTDPKLLDLLPAYVLGALEDGERRLVEEALARGDREVERELAAWTRQLEELAATVPPLAPSATTRARVLRQAVATPPAARRGRLPLAAGLLLALLAGALAWDDLRLRGRLTSLAAERDALAGRGASLARELAATRHDLERAVMAGRIVGAPRTHVVALAGLGSLPQASGHAYHDPDSRRAVFYAGNLPPAPPDRDYQLWFIADGRPVSAGVFDVDAAGGAMLVVDGVAPAASIQAWAVTIEPDGGVTAPTGEMVLKS